MAILIDLKRVDFEYDIWTLVREFCPHTEVLVNSTEKLAEDDYIEYVVKVVFDEVNSKVLASVLAPEASDTCKCTDLEDCQSRMHDKFSNEGIADYLDRKSVKNEAKRLVYDVMKQQTGKDLPWGTLTGIRPTKIPMSLYERKKPLTDDAVYDYMKNNYYVSDEKIDLSRDIAKREIRILRNIDYRDGYSLYIGIPFCPSTCLYCSFTSYNIDAYKKKVDEYVDSVIKEIDYVANAFKDKKLNTVYFGGGTPTTLTDVQLDKLITKVKDSFDFTYVQEFTVEAGRPDSITREKLQVLKKHGVSRISINPQTMKQETLDIIGRKHTVSQVIDAFNMAREEGFDNINMDFIVGLPNEGIEDVRYTMEETLKLNPDSITVHSLAIKRAARLNMFKDEYKELSIENNKEIMSLTAEYAKKMGMKPYYLYRQKNIAGNMENVGYAKEGCEGIYNILIMEEKQTIIALGAGSVTKYVYPDGERIERVDNVKNVDLYIERIDEMIERKINFFQRVLSDHKAKANPNSTYAVRQALKKDVPDAVEHGIYVSNMACLIGKELGLPEKMVYELAVAGMLHDIGKLRLSNYMYGRNEDSFVVEQLRYVRMHSKLSADILKERDYSDFVIESILYHHENFDGSGYPDNLQGESIPLGARILRVCDVFIALTSDRPYRKAFDKDTAVTLMIDEVKNFDMGVFLAFLKVVHDIDLNKDIRKLSVGIGNDIGGKDEVK
ncbi:MAG: coproporphyrinogen dehydrogenase HemZ [Lachnospiraceae bacterium]|nr:coproporphyrinogen dehydrogenase HemZ [Lachnospiraceae bacterium]